MNTANLDELERLLGLLIADQRKLQGLLEQQKVAMSALNHREIEHLGREQEPVRARLMSIETRRRAVTLVIARELKLPLAAEPTLTQIINALPDPLRRARLQVARDELRQVVTALAAASQIAGRLAGAVLGHLNTAMRLLQSAMRDAGTYTRNGAPRMGSRLGAVEAVG